MFTGENSPSLHDVVDLATRGVNLIGTFFGWGGARTDCFRVLNVESPIHEISRVVTSDTVEDKDINMLMKIGK